MWRHGDVLIAAAEVVPAGSTRLPHGVLAEGEVTGHCHRVENPAGSELFGFGAERFLRVTGESVRIVHEEHRPITLPRGLYRVWRQREYTPRAIVTVRD